MSLLREGLAIFKRNPVTSAFMVVLIAAASMGQVISLGSLYPILEAIVSDQPEHTVAKGGSFVLLLEKIGAAPTITNLLLLFIGLGIAYSILNWCAEAFQSLQMRNFEIAVRRELFEAAVRANWTYGRDLQHGEFINVITREAAQYRAMVRYLLYTFGSSLQFGALIAYSLYLNWRLTLFGMSVFALGSVVLVPLLKSANDLGKKSTQLANSTSNRLVAALRSLKMAKALSLESFLGGTVYPSFEAAASNLCRTNILVTGQYAVTEIIAVIAVSSMLYVGLNILAIPKAELLVILLLLFRALPQVRAGIDNYHRAIGYLPSMEAVRHHLNAARQSESRSGGVTVPENWKAIEFRHVSFAYQGRTIVRDLSLQIRRGEFWAIVGPSGIGKTTVLDLLIGLLEPFSGTINIDTLPLNQLDLQSWHKQISYLGQDAFAFTGTLRENLTWGAESHLTDDELLNALRAAKFSGTQWETADNLNRNVGEAGSNLSGGEKQRLALARIFLRHPAVMILDEPTTGLDAATERDILESLSAFFGKTTIIMVTHREELIRGADHVMRIAADGIQVEAAPSRIL